MEYQAKKGHHAPCAWGRRGRDATGRDTAGSSGPREYPPPWHGDCDVSGECRGGSSQPPEIRCGKQREVSMIRIIVPIFAVAFATLMAYGFYLQAKIWHLL